MPFRGLFFCKNGKPQCDHSFGEIGGQEIFSVLSYEINICMCIAICIFASRVTSLYPPKKQEMTLDLICKRLDSHRQCRRLWRGTWFYPPEPVQQTGGLHRWTLGRKLSRCHLCRRFGRLARQRMAATCKLLNFCHNHNKTKYYRLRRYDD